MNHRDCLDLNWQEPSHTPILQDDGVHLWRAHLDLSDVEIKCLTATLSTREIARANRFKFPQHRRRFIAARGILRQLLGNYLQLNPSQVEFGYGDRGKPFLLSSLGNSSLQFNVSHSQEYALLGFSLNHPIGVDIEYLRQMPDALKIAQRFFSQREFSLLRDAPPERQNQLFFLLWTAKEAYLKAIGIGLSGMLDNVEITFETTRVPYCLNIEQDRVALANWSLYSCIPATNYIAAIAVEMYFTALQIDFWHWDSTRLKLIYN